MKRIAVLSIGILAMIASLVTGCAGGDLSQAEVEKMVTDVLVANAEVDTCKFDLDMMTSIEIVGGSQEGKTPVVGTGTGLVDNINKEMYITMTMAVEIPDRGTQEIPVETYLVDGWIYTGMNIPEQGVKWMKMKMPEDMWSKQNQLEQQLELLETADEVNLLGEEDVNGTACYVVEIVPSMDGLMKMVSQIEMPEMEGVDLGELNLANMFKKMSIKQWIAKDNHLFLKSENTMLIEILPGDIGATEADFEKMIEDVSMQMVFYDYNEAVSIELPEEALEAQ